MGEEEEEKKRKGAAEEGASLTPSRAALGLGVGPVTLNVGGKLYSTTLETLTRFPDSMLGAMFRGPRPALTDRHGHYFIDRDGKTFRHILNFLRLGRLDLPEGYPELALLRAEADFYQIRPLLAELNQLVAEHRRRQAHAVLHVDICCQERLLHFTVRGGPQSYGLSTCSLRVFAANVFCTDGHVLELLRGRLGQAGEEETGDAEERDRSGPGQEEVEEGRSQHHMHLEWASRPPDLPKAEYAKQKVHPLRMAPPEGREIGTAAEFLEEVLKLALDQGFRVDAIFPDPEDILNSHSLRFVRH